VSLAPGERVDRYIIEALLGAGGMGEVYRARDTRLQRSVALKLLKPGTDPSSQSRDPSASSSSGALRMLREARAAAALHHRNVVAIYDVGEVQEPPSLRGTTFLAMELVNGKPLRHYVGAPSVPMQQRVSWLRDVARALVAAHDAGLVHRDIKPENVMIADDGTVKVLDFGIAKRTYAPVEPHATTESLGAFSITAKGVAIGTPLYMSPEQMRDEPLDGRADQFSWGVMAYELLGGNLPWRLGGSPLQLVAEILSARPVLPLRDFAPDVPPAAAAVIDRALCKSREDRFPGMRELLAALDAPAAALAPTLERLEVGTKSSRQADGRKAPVGRFAARVGVVLAAIGLVAVCGSYVWRRQAVRSSGVGASLSCYSNADCAAAGTDRVCLDDGTCAARRGCATNADCVTAAGGQPAVCAKREGRCAVVASEDCHALADPGDAKDDHTLWIGAMFPLSGTNSTFGSQLSRATDLARREVAQVARGVPAPRLDVPPRPLALVVCDDNVDPARAARHLVDDLHVPAVIGFGSSQEALDLLPSILVPKHVLSMVAINHADGITSVPSPKDQPRFIWRLTVNTRQMASAIAKAVSDVLEPQLRKALSPSEPIDVALVRANRVTDATWGDATFRALRFNGKSALDNANHFREVVFPDPRHGDPAAIAGDVVNALRHFRPHLVLVLDDDFVLRVVLPLFEQQQPVDGTKPIYLWGVAVEGSDAFETISRARDSAQRFLGVQPQSRTIANTRFTLRYNETYAPDTVDLTVSPAAPYDAVYALAYAAAALGEAPVTGPNLARGLSRLSAQSPVVEVGPAKLLEGFRALSQGQDIGLTGAETRMHLDPQSGEPAVDFDLLCVRLDREAKTALPEESGVVYHSDSARFEGTLRCSQ
jgi:serine/threonine-protein kinase